MDFKDDLANVQEIAEKKVSKVANVNQSTEFTNAIEKAQVGVIQDAFKNDPEFIEGVVKKLKDVTKKYAELEESKAKLENQNVTYASELLETQQRLNDYTQKSDAWEDKRKARQFHYDGVAPIMTGVGINKAMNIVMLYILVTILTPFFLFGKLIKGTIGNLIAGAEDGKRGKMVQGFLWTVLALIVVMAVTIAVYFFLQWQGHI